MMMTHQEVATARKKQQLGNRLSRSCYRASQFSWQRGLGKRATTDEWPSQDPLR